VESDLPSVLAIASYLLDLPRVSDPGVVFIGEVDIVPLTSKRSQQAGRLRIINVRFEQKMGFILIPLARNDRRESQRPLVREDNCRARRRGADNGAGALLSW
jgi:hypothetical protein